MKVTHFFWVRSETAVIAALVSDGQSPQLGGPLKEILIGVTLPSVSSLFSPFLVRTNRHKPGRPLRNVFVLLRHCSVYTISETDPGPWNQHRSHSDDISDILGVGWGRVHSHFCECEIIGYRLSDRELM